MSWQLKEGLKTLKPERRSWFLCVGLVVFLGGLMMVITPDENLPEMSFPDPTGRSVVVLDPGHGGHDQGAKSRTGAYEKNLALDIATRVEGILKENHYTVILTRHTDQFRKLSERTAIGNATDNSVFVSIHLNDSRSSQATGIETYFTGEKDVPPPKWMWIGIFTKPPPLLDPESETLASLIHASLVNRIAGTDRGVRSKAYYVVRGVRRPSVLVECGFVSNPLEAQLLTNAEYRDRIAYGIAEGIFNYDRSRARPEIIPDIAKK